MPSRLEETRTKDDRPGPFALLSRWNFRVKGSSQAEEYKAYRLLLLSEGYVIVHVDFV